MRMWPLVLAACPNAALESVNYPGKEPLAGQRRAECGQALQS
jgi:hypothetical protein